MKGATMTQQEMTDLILSRIVAVSNNPTVLRYQLYEEIAKDIATTLRKRGCVDCECGQCLSNDANHTPTT